MSTETVRQVQQLTAEVPDGVMDAAWARMTAERCPEANAACDTAGVQRCGHRLDAALTVAFNAGRESVFDQDEWRVCVLTNTGDPDPAQHFAQAWSNISKDVAAARKSLEHAQKTEWPNPWLEHRRTGATEWERVAE